MVHLSSSSILDASPPSECSEEAKEKQGDAHPASPPALTTLQLALAASTTTYQGYDTYIENSLICLKHKIRNIEKKKIKLEEYKKRISNGESLNQDQMAAVETYEEVVHNLKFAKEIQKTIGALSQDLLKAQRKAVKQEQTAQMEEEKRRLRTVLHIHYILQNLQQDRIRKDLRSGLNGAPFLSAHDMERLLELSSLLGCHRDDRMSLQEQMEQVSVAYWDLLEGRDKPVVGSTFKHMKEQLARLMDCEYFDHVPAPESQALENMDTLVERTIKPQRALSDLSTLMRNEVPTKEFLNRCYLPDTAFSDQTEPSSSQAPQQNWKAEFLAMKQQDPPDSWDMEFTDTPPAPLQPVPKKPWGEAVGFAPKEQITITKSTEEPKERRKGKLKGKQGQKLAPKAKAPIEVLGSPSSLPKDPDQRKQQLLELLEKIKGSFSFMQDSVLDGDYLPTSRHSWMSSPAERSLLTDVVQKETRTQSDSSSPSNHIPKALHSTPLPTKVLHFTGEADLTNGDLSLDNIDQDLAANKDVHQENMELSESKGFESQSLFRRESTISLTLSEGAAEQVTDIIAPLPPRSDADLKSNVSKFSDSYNLSYTTASTQTPPDMDFDDLDPLQPAVTLYQSECPVTSSCQVQLSPGQPVGALSCHAEPYYPRGSLRGMARGGRGLAHSFRSPGGFDSFRPSLRSPRGSYIPKTHTTRDCVPVLYRVQDSGYQVGYNQSASGKKSKPRATWRNSSQVNSPERDNETFISADSGYSDSRCATPVDVPFATQSPTLVPVYPMPEQMRVAFSAACTSNFVPGALDQTIVFDVLHCNLGEAFDMHLGRFSCPVNGTYVFIFHILKLAIDVPLYINLMKNDEVMVSAYANDSAPDHEMASNQAVLQLYQGDQVWLQLHRGALYSSSWKYSTFSGFLLYQD